jgi:hypothetical protein
VRGRHYAVGSPASGSRLQAKPGKKKKIRKIKYIEKEALSLFQLLPVWFVITALLMVSFAVARAAAYTSVGERMY